MVAGGPSRVARLTSHVRPEGKPSGHAALPPAAPSAAAAANLNAPTDVPLDAGERAAWDRDGFVVRRGALSPQELDWLASVQTQPARVADPLNGPAGARSKMHLHALIRRLAGPIANSHQVACCA
jgi:hypothetical protein